MAQNTGAPLDWADIKKSAAAFAIKYKNAKKEASLKQPFWIDFMDIFGIDAIELGAFEYFVKYIDGYSGEIDYFWPGKVIIEHKSSGKDLDKALDQVMNYVLAIEDRNAENRDEKPIPIPKYIIVSDFQRIRLLNIKEGERDDITIMLEDLPDEIDCFGFLAGYKDKRIEGQHPVNVKAAEAIGELYDFLKESNYAEDKIDRLLIRLVFCLFAEDADIFEKNAMTEYIACHTSQDGSNFGGVLNEVFSVLNTPYESRQKNMSEALQNFPYANGGLFEEVLPIAYFNREMRDCFFRASKLDWRFISPAIFGSLFQFIMDPEMRRQLGAHYTSEENILKVINPLFMDDLRSEYNAIKRNKKELSKFWNKLSKIRVLDPACGCGNFLIIVYRELRRLEMDVMESIYGNQMILDTSRLHVDHFYGIEIGAFPAMIANVSILLMDHIMNMESRNRFGESRNIIPLKEKANIVCGDSLELDWRSVVDPKDLAYIVGNPPFVGAKVQTKEQRNQMTRFFEKNAGVIDYVSAWYVKAAWMMGENKSIKTAFVSTNSITQGEQVEPLWKPLTDKGVRINFAYTTFRWNNEAKGVAAVHVIIIGLSYNVLQCKLFNHSNGLNGDVVSKRVRHINAYLVDGPDVFLLNRTKPVCEVPEIGIGNKPIDGGNYLFIEEEKDLFISKEPNSEKYFKPWIGSKEFINGYRRYCLWLGDCPSDELRKMPECMKRIEAVRAFRLSSVSAGTRKLADTPRRFHVENMPNGTYIVIPETSSENRSYIPIGFLDEKTMCSNAVKIMPDATLYHFGILTSNMHMVWTRYVCGRLKSDYRYSVGIVYNNFIWPDTEESKKLSIEEKAKKILEIRSKYEGQSLADLYNPNAMPADLLKAHQALDKEVEKAYRNKPFGNDEDRISYLFKLYVEKTGSN